MTTLLLTPMIFIPFLGAALQALAPRRNSARWLALAASIMSSLIGVAILVHGLMGMSSENLTDQLPWVGSYAINYELAVDGVNRIAILIVSLLFPILIASEWDRARGARGMYALFLTLQASLLGAVCAQDLFLLFFFWALSSIPVFFLVGIWGGAGREQAAFRTLVISAIGNAFLFGAMILIYYSKDPHTFLIRDLVQGGIPSRSIMVLGVELSASVVAFLFICIGLAFRAPVWPIHGWFSQLVIEAPASVSVAVAAAVVPCAIQIFAKLTHLLFPAIFSDAANWILIFGLSNLLIGAITANAQRKVFSLLSCLVLIEVGISLIALGSHHSSALVGMVYHQLSAALSIAGLGLLFGSMAQRRSLPDLQEPSAGGSAAVLDAPMAGSVMALSLATLVGVPGLSGFIGQGLVFMGSYAHYPWIIVPAGLSLLLLTTCLFGVYRTLFLSGGAEFGAETELTLREKAYLIPLVVFMILFGFYPKPVLDVIRPAAEQMLASAPSTEKPDQPETSQSIPSGIPGATREGR